MFLTAFLPTTGLRPSELRLADLEDLDTAVWTLKVRHPKGEDKYARRREVVVLPQARRATTAFLEARKRYLRKQGLAEAASLIPGVDCGQARHQSSNWFRVIKARIEEEAGVKFKLKDFRSTLTSVTVKGDMSRLPAMSAQLSVRA